MGVLQSAIAKGWDKATRQIALIVGGGLAALGLLAIWLAEQGARGML